MAVLPRGSFNIRTTHTRIRWGYSWGRISSHPTIYLNKKLRCSPVVAPSPALLASGCPRRAKRPQGYSAQSGTVTMWVPGLSFTLPPGRSPVTDLSKIKITHLPQKLICSAARCAAARSSFVFGSRPELMARRVLIRYHRADLLTDLPHH